MNKEDLVNKDTADQRGDNGRLTSAPSWSPDYKTPPRVPGTTPEGFLDTVENEINRLRERVKYLEDQRSKRNKVFYQLVAALERVWKEKILLDADGSLPRQVEAALTAVKAIDTPKESS